MEKPLCTIITRTGDNGSTGLANGERIHKDAPRIKAIGEVDELNSSLGLLLCEELPEEIRTALLGIQNTLFDLGSELGLSGQTCLSETEVDQLENLAAKFDAPLPPLKEFILPGGTRAAAIAQLCRAICRRAERALIVLATTESVADSSRRYLNRLSDLLFVIARHINQHQGQAELSWKKRGNKA